MTHPHPPPHAPVPPTQGSNQAWTSFGLGLGAIAAAFMPLMGIVSLGLAVAGVIVGIGGVRAKAEPYWASVVGIATSGVAIVIDVYLFFVLFIPFFTMRLY